MSNLDNFGWLKRIQNDNRGNQYGKHKQREIWRHEWSGNHANCRDQQQANVETCNVGYTGIFFHNPIIMNLQNVDEYVQVIFVIFTIFEVQYFGWEKLESITYMVFQGYDISQLQLFEEVIPFVQ